MQLTSADWPAAYSDAARTEGWDVFFIDGDPERGEVERIENPEDVGYVAGQRAFPNGDDDVIAFVRRQAAAGSPVHALALAFEVQTHGA